MALKGIHMRITENQLRRIIRQEVQTLREAGLNAASPSLNELLAHVEQIAPDASHDGDDRGEIVVYTGLLLADAERLNADGYAEDEFDDVSKAQPLMPFDMYGEQSTPSQKYPSLNKLLSHIRLLAPAAWALRDEEGQIMVYTGLHEPTKSNDAPLMPVSGR
jgi:hypothetical protein